jgi:hypothetical protein
MQMRRNNIICAVCRCTCVSRAALSWSMHGRTRLFAPPPISSKDWLNRPNRITYFRLVLLFGQRGVFKTPVFHKYGRAGRIRDIRDLDFGVTSCVIVVFPCLHGE